MGIAVQDLKTRLISVFLFLVLGLVLILQNLLYAAEPEAYSFILSNLLFILGKISLLFFYLRFIRKIDQPIFQTAFGLGDVWMMIALAFVFPLPTLIWFLLSSYIVTLIYALLSQQASLPLAGIMSFCMAAILCCNKFFEEPILNTLFH